LTIFLNLELLCATEKQTIESGFFLSYGKTEVPPMLLLLIPLALLPLLLLLYFAFSKKSGPRVKKAALIALLLALVTLGVSAVLVFMGPLVRTGPARDAVPDIPAPSAGADLRLLIIMGIFLLLFLGLVIVLAIRDQRRSARPWG
jgi:hypothetical protein